VSEPQENPPEWDYRIPVCAHCRPTFAKRHGELDLGWEAAVIERCHGCGKYGPDTRRCGNAGAILFALCNHCGTLHTNTMGKYAVCACRPGGTLCEVRGASRIESWKINGEP